MKNQNAYEKYQVRQDRIKVVASGKGWVASKTLLVIHIQNGYLVYSLRQD